MNLRKCKPVCIISIAMLLALCLLYQAALSQQDARSRIQIKGFIKGQDDGMLILTYQDVAGTIKRDTAFVSNSQFSFSPEMREPLMASLSGKIKSRSVDDPNFTNFFLEPGKDLSIELVADHFKEAVIKGSPIQNEYAGLMQSRKKITVKYQGQLDSLRVEKDHEKNAAIRERLRPYFSEMDEEDYRFFRKHPASFVTAYMLRFHVADLHVDSLQAFYTRLGTRVQQSGYGRDIAEEITKLRKGSPGVTAQDFVTIDLNGKRLVLSQFKGKYVLIDFWASWCVPCRKGSPHLKDIYSKYREKGLEIIGVADDDRAQDAWRMAIEKDGTGSWYHVLRGLQVKNGEFDRGNDISEKFGIHSLPTRILIDKDGMIIGRFGEKEDELDKMLNDLLGS